MPALNDNNGYSNQGSGGGIVVKARLGDDVRKVHIHNTELTHNELLLMMQRIFKGRLTANDNVLLKYSDEDGDMITIGDDSELSLAIHSSHNGLKLILFVNGQVPQSLDSSEASQIRDELRKMRDLSIRLMDQLETKHGLGCKETGGGGDRPVQNMTNGPSRRQREHSVQSVRSDESRVKQEMMIDGGREFDPLQQQQQQTWAQQDTASEHVSEPEQPPHVAPPVPEPTAPTAPVYSHPPSVAASRPESPSSVMSRGTTQFPPQQPPPGMMMPPVPQPPQQAQGQGYTQQADTQAQENVATIQPTVHQQLNPDGQTATMNGMMPTYNNQPTQQQQAPHPPIMSVTQQQTNMSMPQHAPPPVAAQMFGGPPQTQQQANPGYAPVVSAPSQPQTQPTPPPPVSYQSAYNQPQQQHPPAPVQQQQMPMAPPQQQQQAQQQYAPPPPSSTPTGMAPPPQPQPPMGGMAPPPMGAGYQAGPNPFARPGGMGGVYPRASFGAGPPPQPGYAPPQQH